MTTAIMKEEANDIINLNSKDAFYETNFLGNNISTHIAPHFILRYTSLYPGLICYGDAGYDSYKKD